MATINRFIFAMQLIAVFGCMSLVAEPTKSEKEKKAEKLKYEKIMENLDKIEKKADEAIKGFKKAGEGFASAGAHAKQVIETCENMEKQDRWSKKVDRWGMRALVLGWLAYDSVSDFNRFNILSGNRAQNLAQWGLEVGIHGAMGYWEKNTTYTKNDDTLITYKDLFMLGFDARMLLQAVGRIWNPDSSYSTPLVAWLASHSFNDLWQKDADTQDQEKQEPAPEKEEAQGAVLDTEI